MATLIVYMSKHSTTKKVAEMIKRGLTDHKVELINLGDSKVKNIETYDTVIVGGSIHAGSIQRKIKNFCITNSPLLLTKKLGLFMCYMETEKGNEEFEQNFPVELRNHSKANGLLGGEFIFEKMNYFEKLIVRKISNINNTVSRLNTKEINSFIDNMNKD